jgi:outer membrane cobalamin receptor
MPAFTTPRSFRLAPLLILLLWLAAPAATRAQITLTGQALDRDSRAGLPFASVVLQTAAPAAKVAQAVVADEAGRFSLPNVRPGHYQLQVMQVGYATLTQPLDLATGSAATRDLGVLALLPAAQGLGEVVVTGRKPLLEQQPDRVTMHVDGSLLAAGNSTYDVLAAAPGVQLVEGQPLRLRGKTGVVIFLNNKRLPGGTSLETLLASIPADQLDRVELIHNPSSKYDADAAGGVIEIYTKRSKAPGWTANLAANARQGQRTGGGASGGLQASNAKFDLAASGSYSRRGGFERNAGNRTFFAGNGPVAGLAQHSDLNKVLTDGSLSASLNYHPSARATLGFSTDLQAGSLVGAGSTDAVLTQPAGPTTSHVQETVTLRESFANYNAFYKRELDSLHSYLLLSSTYATLLNVQQQTFDQSLRGPADSTELPTYLRNYIPATYHISTTAADYVHSYPAGARLEAGLKYTDTRNQSRQQAESLVGGTWQPQALSPFAELGYQEQVAAAYLTGNRSFGKLSLQTGLRAERTHYRVEHGIDSTYFNLFPNVRADYKLSADYTTSLGYARNIQRPAYESLIPYERFQDTYTSSRGNARLQPEYAHSFSWNNIYKNYSLQLSYTRTSGAISLVYLYDPTTLRLTDTQRNLLSRHLASATLLAPLTLAKWWTMSGSAILTYQQLNLPDPLDATRTLNRHKTAVELSSDNTFSLGNNWSARVYGAYYSPSLYGIFDIDAYSYAVVGVKKAFLGKRATLNLSVADLFYQFGSRVSTDIRPVVFENRLRNDTRQVRLAFTFNFGQANFKSKRVETNTNAAERGRLGM